MTCTFRPRWAEEERKLMEIYPNKVVKQMRKERKKQKKYEYRIGKHFGILAQLGGFTAFFGGMNGDEVNGISYWGPSLGMAVHL